MIYNIDQNNIVLEDAILKGPKYPHSITIRPDDNRDKGFNAEPYFKYYEKSDTSTGNKLLRISMIKPEFVNHYNMMDAWDFNNKDKKELINTLNMKRKSMIDLDTTWRVWDEMLYILATKFMRIDYNLIKDWPIPDYMQLPTIKAGTGGRQRLIE